MLDHYNVLAGNGANRDERRNGRKARLGSTSTPIPHPAMVAVIGPPGAGKSTVVRAVAVAEGAVVFRLREAVRAYTDVVAVPETPTDPLGWVDAASVRRVLDEAFVAGRFPTGDALVLLDNFPGTAAQLDLLLDTARAIGRRVGLLRLRASEQTVAGRTARRRVCPTCGPDPHHPVGGCAQEPARCAGCGNRLVHRESDSPPRHALRLARYLANVDQILEHAPCARETRTSPARQPVHPRR